MLKLNPIEDKIKGFAENHLVSSVKLRIGNRKNDRGIDEASTLQSDHQTQSSKLSN